MTFASRSRVFYLALRRFNHSNNKPAVHGRVFSFKAFCNNGEKKINNFSAKKLVQIGGEYFRRVGNIFHERERVGAKSDFPRTTRGSVNTNERREGKNGVELELCALIFHQPEQQQQQQQHRKKHWRGARNKPRVYTVERKKNRASIEEFRSRNQVESIDPSFPARSSSSRNWPALPPSNALSSRFRPICGLSSIEDFNSAIQGSPVHRYDSVPHVQTGGGPFTRSRRNAVHAETRARYASAWPPTRDGGEVLYVARGGSIPNFVGIGIKVIREAFVSSCN